MSDSTNRGTKEIHYIPCGGMTIAYVTKNGQAGNYYTLYTDHLDSVVTVTNEANAVVYEQNFDACLSVRSAAKAEGRERNPQTWETLQLPITENSNFSWVRGFTGHEMLRAFNLVNMNNRMFDPVVGRMLAVDNYVQDPSSTQSYNRYSYCWNNPLKYTDPSGEFLVWSVGNSGFSIGLNFTPVGIPLGFGLNVGWGDGFTPGVYGVVGVRVGGTGFGSGATISQNLSYNFKYDNWSTSTTASTYASFGLVNVGGSISANYDITNQSVSYSWGVSAGVGIGNDARGLGLNVGYGSSGFSYGLGGCVNSHAWDSNPNYEPERYNDGDGGCQKSNNCYSYAKDEIDNNNRNIRGLQPGADGGFPFDPKTDLTLECVSEAVLYDGRIKSLNFFNKLGFGKRGYYSVYLVIDENVDYHWYRQDKGGTWSHKPGYTPVTNLDDSGNIIRNPVRANLGNYNSGGKLFWIKR